MAVVIVDAVRTCAGARGGALNNWHAVDLLAYSYEGLLKRLDLDPERIDSVIATCRTTIGEQAFNVARAAVLAAGLPESIAALTAEGASAAGIGALQYATGIIASGSAQAVIVSGVETPSRVVAGSSIGIGTGKPFGPRVHERFAADGGLLPPGLIAERMAARYKLKRTTLDVYAAKSRERALAHEQSGRNKAYLLPVPLRVDRATEIDPWLHTDELLDPPSDLTELKPLFEPDGVITAGTMAQPVDGSAALFVASDEFVARNNLPFLARVERVVTRGARTLDGSTGFEIAREMCGNELPDLIDVFEDFAPVPIRFAKEAGIEVNAKGGALAIGDMGGAAAVALIAGLAHAVSEQQTAGLGVVAGAGDLAGASLLIPS